MRSDDGRACHILCYMVLVKSQIAFDETVPSSFFCLFYNITNKPQ